MTVPTGGTARAVGRTFAVSVDAVDADAMDVEGANAANQLHLQPSAVASAHR